MKNLIQFNLINIITNKMDIKNLDILFVKQLVMDIDMDIMTMIMMKY